jgi:ABC-type dipeptide/oligopeptide/nickel transport system permease component
MRIIQAIAQRVGTLIPTLLGLIILTYFITHYIPANPAAMIAGPYATKEQVAKIQERYGFDKPVHVRFWMYLKRLSRGDLGDSIYTHRSILQEMIDRSAATLELGLCSIMLAVLLGVPAGVLSALRRNSLFDFILRAVTIGGIALAVFWIGIELQLFFGYKLSFFPITGRISTDPPHHITGFYIFDSMVTLNGKAFLSSMRSLALPVITLGVGSFATIVRFTRAGVLDTMNKDFIVYARAMGMPHRMLVYKYLLRNAVTSTVAQIGLVFGWTLASGYVVERVFSWPGIGSFGIQSMLLLDYNGVLAVALWTGLAYATGNLLADIILLLVDPRVMAK